VLSLKRNIFASLDDNWDIPREDTYIFYLLTVLEDHLTVLVDYFNSVLLVHILSVNATWVSTPKNPNAVFWVFCSNVFLCEVWRWLTPIAKTCCLLGVFFKLYLCCVWLFIHIVVTFWKHNGMEHMNYLVFLPLNFATLCLYLPVF
jgi:hypothetical protein